MCPLHRCLFVFAALCLMASASSRSLAGETSFLRFAQQPGGAPGFPETKRLAGTASFGGADAGDASAAAEESRPVRNGEVVYDTHWASEAHAHADHLHGGDGSSGHGAHDIKHDRTDSHAPAGLMGDHVHEQGEVMVEYRFLQMYMDNNRFGDQRVTSRQALDVTGVAFGVTPTNMSMEMHMLHFMYGWTDNITLYIMPMWMSNTMDHERRDGSTFRTHNDGFSDMPMGFLWRIYEGCTDELIVNFGFSAPTGDIDNLTQFGGEFPYPMRLGSGTFDFMPGVTYRSFYDWGTIGAQLATDLPIGEANNYSEGDLYRLNFWGTWLAGREQRTALTYRVENWWQNQWNGFDPAFGALPTTVSTVRPDMRGGYRLSFGYGFIHTLPGGGRLNFEMTHPVYQNLNGVQLETDWQLFASYSKAFGAH